MRRAPLHPNSTIESQGHRLLPDDASHDALLCFVLPLGTFDSIASGHLDPVVIELLRQTERSRRLLLLHHLVTSCSDDPSLLRRVGGIQSTKALLKAVEDHDPAFLHDQLDYPQTGMWLAYAARRMAGVPDDSAPLWVQIGGLASLAAAAAIRARLEFEIDVPLTHGQVLLPHLGKVDLPPSGGPDGVARVCGTSDEFAVTYGDHRVLVRRPFGADQPGWTPIPVMRLVGASGRALRVRLDHLDPAPALVGLPPAATWSSATAVEWRRRLDAAWQLLDADHPEDAEALVAGFTALVPLQPHGRVLAGSSAEGFGAASISLLPPVDLACALVHEFHHSALNGLLHLVDLCEPGEGGAVYYAPWRDDPRPFLGIVHGAYAFTAVTDFWSRRRHADDGLEARRADLEFALWRAQAALVVDWLAGSGRMTSAGTRMIDLLRGRVDGWLGEPVASDVARLALIAARSHRAAWRAHHVQPDPAWVDRAAHAWMFDQCAPPASGQRVVTDDTARCLNRVFVAARREIGGTDPPGDSLSGDWLLVRGATARARSSYLSALTADPDDARPWAGIGPALADDVCDGTPLPAAVQLLLEFPERVRATYRRLRNGYGQVPDVLDLAGWLASS